MTGVSDSNGGSVAYQYDSLGNRIQMTSSDGRTRNVGYDAGNRLSQISLGTENFIFGYDPSGRRTLLTYPHGVTASYSYDPAGRLADLTHAAAGGEIDRITYTHDGVGNRLSRTALDTRNLYSYDNLYRLTQSLPIMLQGKGKEHPKKAASFTYDPAGNRQTGPKSGDHYAYNPGNQLTSDREHQYVYDGNGNLIGKTETDDGETETWTYAYDGENRLISAVKQEADETKTVNFKYDPFGRRIEKRVTEDGTTRTKRYFYDNEDILLEHDENGVIGNRYLHGPGIDEPLSVTTDGGTYYYHADRLDTIIALTDTNQHIVQKYDYDAFGNLHDEKNTVKQPYTYTGREWDKEIKLYYYRARYYDAKVGRFLSKDPFPGVLTDSQTLNRYPYVQNNPVNFTDPYGLWVNPVDYWGDFFGGAGDFYQNFNDMNTTRLGGGDKYFHCKANCEAARRGLGGEDAACLISNAKEYKDVYWSGHPASDSAADQAANRYGREGGANTNLPCELVCQPYRPAGLPPQY